MKTIRDLFSDQRPIDRQIEKVIDYTVDDPSRLAREIDEYVVTERLEASFRRFIEVYDAGVRLGDVTEVGLWISGFYGSGKSSLTKYLGFALDPGRRVGAVAFLDRLAAHFRAPDLQQLYRTTAKSFPATVILLDLARDQLVESTAMPITNVLYAKVLQHVGYSGVPKLADVEVRLDEQGRLDAFRAAYRERFPGKGEWADVHDDPLIGPARAAQLVPSFLGDDFPTPDSFRGQHFQERLKVSELAQRMIRLLQAKTGREQILFLVDEVGQYVAPRTDLMLNLDGLVRSFKEIGRGKVWLIATAQQTLNEIVQKAILNSAELYRLRDRFPIGIELDAADIKEITRKRLLTKRPEAQRQLQETFRADGEMLRLQTRVEGFGANGSNRLNGQLDGRLDADTFADMYPFLPVHFDLVMALIRRLARRTGGTGLRSAIRVVQDLLVDASRALPPGVTPIADRPVKRLACADDIFDTLRADIAKELPHVVEGVARVEGHSIFGKDPVAVRVAKAIAALQPLDDFPRTAENLAALLYPMVGEAPLVEPVREVLVRLVEARELGIVELRGEQDGDPLAAPGYLFLSDKIRPLQQKRDAHRPTGAERRQVQVELLRLLFDPQPETRLETVKTVRAGLSLDRLPVAGEGADLRFVIEPVPSEARERRLAELQNETRSRADWQATILWLVTWPQDLDELLEDACRSAHLARTTSEHEADRDVAQYIRAERRRLERLHEAAKSRMAAALRDGDFVFRGLARPLREYDPDGLIGACNAILARAAAEVFPAFHHAPLAAKTNQAVRFLEQDRLDRMPRDRDPLALVETRSGHPRVKTAAPPLSEALRAFSEKVDAAGTGRLQGAFVQDLFSAPPYGWFKDTTRYLFAALLAAGEIEVHTPAGVLRTPGPGALDAFNNTASFNRVGLALRGSKPPIEALDRAARVLETLFGVEVLPLEDHISRAVRAQVPPLMEKIGSLPDRLRLLGLPGEKRARAVLEGCSDLLREDAGGAASILGAPDRDPLTDVSAGIRWAREAVECLDGGGEDSIRRAAALRRELVELAELFPELREAAAPEPLVIIDEVLAGERFPDRMADLRGALLALEQSAHAAYMGQYAGLQAKIQTAQEGLQAMSEWGALEADDRDAIVQRLSGGDLPQDPDATNPIPELRRLLTWTARLPTLADCQAEVRRRLPATPPPGADEPQTAGKVKVQRVTLGKLLPGSPLDSPEAVDRWVQGLRRRLIELVELGPIRIVDRSTEPGDD
jgi:hypothetical protein